VGRISTGKITWNLEESEGGSPGSNFPEDGAVFIKSAVHT
jgi:hypothetical protein